MAEHIGIDLGTTHSLVAATINGVPTVLPDPETGESLEKSSGASWTSVFADEIMTIADQNPSVCEISELRNKPCVVLEKCTSREALRTVLTSFIKWPGFIGAGHILV